MERLDKRRIALEIVDADLRNQIYEHTANPHVAEILIKDAILIEAALRSDHIIASLDDKARRHYVEAARHIERIRDIVWINPCKTPDAIIRWLEKGAKPEPSFQLLPKPRR